MPHSSSFPSLNIPDVDLWTFLCERKEKPFPDDKEIFTEAETDRTYTYSHLRNAAYDFGRGLRELWGWKKGQVLVIYTPNSIDTAVVTLGALWAGGVISPANPLYTVEELTFQLKNSKAKALVTQRPFLDVACQAARNAGIPENRIILVGNNKGDISGPFRHFSNIRGNGADRWRPDVEINAKDDLAFVVYSSGTTGLPKGVCLTHRNMVANVVQFSYVDGSEYRPYGGLDGKGDKLLGVLPLFHIYGLTCLVLSPVALGWHTILMERFHLEKALQLIQKYKITFSYVPPPIVLAFGKDPAVDNYDLTSLRVLHSGAAPLTKELTEAVWNRLKTPVKQGYGLSETSPITHAQRTEEWAKFMGSVGKLFPNMEAKIVDENGNEVAEGKPGELWLKGPNVFKGYLDNPEMTRAAFSLCGFFKTGDVFVRDKWGNYYCVDRLKELIKYKGFPVPPAELEGLLLGHDDVVDVCVIGVEDRAQATEVPRAYVVLKRGVPATESKAAELVEWLAKRVAPHKKLRGGVRFVDQVPKSPSGKILRRIVRDQAKKEVREAAAKL
ncbi:hypothetical protein VTK73DRAFT_8902 [Phialemonium thermophilum]|uniref:4-coumarate--CoA ligase n=1 Tax=Phialemonium thermophilum TaxID=223376 RepID=A0ABR3XN24_9PEZI